MTSRRRRIWAELLDPQTLGDASTVRLLARYHVEPLIALQPHDQTPAMADALRALDQGGVRVGLWPLLGDQDGYWPSEHNAAAFCRRVHDALAFTRDAAVEVQTVAIDLEPPLRITQALYDRSSRGRMALELLAQAAHPRRVGRRTGAVRSFRGLRAELADRGIESLAAVFPTAVADLYSPLPLFEYLLQTPALAPGWDRISPMFYTSLIEAMLPRALPWRAHRLLATGARIIRRRLGVRGSVSLGLVAPGKLEDEPAYGEPEELKRDVAVARGAGVEDLALYSLDGVLRRGAPERWLEPFTAA